MVASFPEEEEEEEDPMTETRASLFTYGKYSIKFSPLNTGDTFRRLGFSSDLLNQ
jgi:hypothetical protein